MTSRSKPPRFPQTASDRGGLRGLGRPEIIGVALSLFWAVASLAYAASGSETEASMGLFATAALLLLPLACLWAALFALKTIAALRGEVDALRQELAALSHGAPGSGKTRGSDTAADLKLASVKLDAPRMTRDATALAANRGAAAGPASATAGMAARPAVEADQPSLALDAPEQPSSALCPADFIAALQFPESAEDEAGIMALRLALADRECAKLIRAAQDVLTLLSQESVFMDNLPPEPCHPELWRRFAAGERGAAVSAVGGIHDRTSLALTAGRMREDMIFRDAAHHFLRTFDRLFQGFEKVADDGEILALAQSRTARAFMLVGRVSGVFD